LVKGAALKEQANDGLSQEKEKKGKRNNEVKRNADGPVQALFILMAGRAVEGQFGEGGENGGGDGVCQEAQRDVPDAG